QTPEHRRGRGAVVRGGEVAGVDVQRSVWITRGDVDAACALGTKLIADGDQAGIRLDLHAAPRCERLDRVRGDLQLRVRAVQLRVGAEEADDVERGIANRPAPEIGRAHLWTTVH